MAETRKNVVVRIVRSDGTLVSGSGKSPTNKQVLQVALPKNVVFGPNNGTVINSRTSSECTDHEEAPLSKNAILARQNRLKKKNYIKGLEEKLRKCKEENEDLKRTVTSKDADIVELKNEVKYLKNVLANQKEISSLLKTIRRGREERLSTSLQPPIKRQRTSQSESETPTIAQGTSHVDSEILNWLPDSPGSNFSSEFESMAGSGGVCLHVFNERVSLEFCHHCSKNAENNFDADESLGIVDDVQELWELGPAVNPESLQPHNLDDFFAIVLDPFLRNRDVSLS